MDPQVLCPPHIDLLDACPEAALLTSKPEGGPPPIALGMPPA